MAEKVTMKEIMDVTRMDVNREVSDDEMMEMIGGLANIEPKFDIGNRVSIRWGSRIGEIQNMEQRYVEGIERMEWFYEVKWGIDETHPHEAVRWEFESMLKLA